ncbi:MAG: hypothetical protein J6Y02_08055 [Pseudobutyrivibrio sp.]|nr:hypothetical protein [Pseudobutyrivibrio sp.]
MNESMANQAFDQQGPKKTPEGTDKSYAGHDRFQNGVLDRSNSRIYVAGWDKNWGATDSASGFFTDQATIDSCVHEGKLNTNELDSKLQTKLSDYYEDSLGVIQAHSDVSAYDVDYKRLDELKAENPELYNKLTAPDGKQSSEIKVAYGEVGANVQHGEGGGHQYYINKETFKEAVEAGVFKYNPNESFSVNPEPNMKSVERKDISSDEYRKREKLRRPMAARKHRQIEKELAQERAEQKIDLKDQNDRYRVKDNTDYIAKPDPAYNDNKIQKEKIKNDEIKKRQELQRIRSNTRAAR